MPSTIVVSRRIYLPALIVAVLLVALVIGSIGVRAQALCEYVTYTPVCVAKDGGAMRVDAQCGEDEDAGYLVNADILTCILIPLEQRITALEARLDACSACSRRRP